MKSATENKNRFKKNANVSIKKTGLRLTEPRLKVLAIFENSPNRHLYAEDIYKIMLQENIEVGLATIYRVLTQFEQAGILQKQFFEGNKTAYELNNKTNHYHIVCSDCSAVQEFEDDSLGEKFAQIAQKNGFTINDSLVYLYVSCNKKTNGQKCPNDKG